MKTQVDQTLPVEIWADMLEDAGVDTSELRAWLSMGLGMGLGMGMGTDTGTQNNDTTQSLLRWRNNRT